MKMAALQLMQQKANKDKTAALHDTSTADAESESKPQALEASEKVPDGTPTSPTSSESTLTPDDAEATNVSEKSAPENQEAPADLKSEVPTANTNGTHEPSAAERQNGGSDSPLDGKEADENIPGLAQAKELAESLAAEDGSGIGTSCERPKRAWEGNKSKSWQRHAHILFFPLFLILAPSEFCHQLIKRPAVVFFICYLCSFSASLLCAVCSCSLWGSLKETWIS